MRRTEKSDGTQASNPDFVYIASPPTESVGIVRAANEIGLKTKLFGGGMVGLQYAAIKTQLGELLNKIVDYDFYVPEPTVPFKGIESFLARYQAKAPRLAPICSAISSRLLPMPTGR
jgi:branched-chain amino acid transport system substrate-binding protein